MLGLVDVEEYVGENLAEVSDWELNFKMLKAAAKDADRLPNEIRVDCYRVSLVGLKATIDEQMKRMKEALGTSLRKKVSGGRLVNGQACRCAFLCGAHACTAPSCSAAVRADQPVLLRCDQDADSFLAH